MSVFGEARDKLYSQYIEIVDFLKSQYGEITPWLCRRTIMALVADQVFILRDGDRRITTYGGWFLISPDMAVNMKSTEVQLESATEGSMVWVMDAASTDGRGLRMFQRHLRERYPVSSGFKGIAWLRNKTRLVLSPRQQGVKDEMVS